MSLIKCKECGQEISKDAEVCPHCGKKNKKDNPLVGFLGLLFICWLIGITIDHNIENSKQEASVEQKIEKNRSIEIQTKLEKKISPEIKNALENLKVESKKRSYSVTIALKPNYATAHKEIAYQIVREILNILVEEGHRPAREEIFIFANIYQNLRKAGETGEDLIHPFGTATYNYHNDSIKWENFKKPWYFP